MIRSGGVLLGLFVTVFWIGAHGAYGETFTLSQVYSRALKRNEELQIAREGVFHAEQEHRRATSTVLPKVTLSGTYNRSPEEVSGAGFLIQPEEGFGADARLLQPLYAGGKLRAGLRMARSGIEVAKKDLNLSSEGLLLRVARAFYGLLRAQKNLEAQRHNVERLWEHRRLSELRFKVGEVTETVLLRAESELAEAQAELVARENDLAIQQQELRMLADLPEAFDVEEPPLPEIPAETSHPVLMALASKSRDDLRRSELQEEIAQEEVTMARAHFFPSLSLEGTYFRRDQDPQPTFFIEESWVIGVRLDFPIFEGGLRTAELSQARSKLRQGRLATEKLKKEIELDVTRAKLNLEAIRKVLQSREEQLRFARKNYEMVSKQFMFGLVTNIDLLDANQTLIEAERDMISATYDHHLAILDLQRSTGMFLPMALAGIKPSI